ncbi:MAG TPA: phosphoglucosamine mutase [Thermoanaerobacterales bacterium]|nr:phosphoglucosamine mutase [Thermoanaerobacterales bacterium]
MSDRLFGTDGVRGIANLKLTPQLAFELGRASAYLLGDTENSPLIVIGKDTRVSGDMLEAALASGVCSVGGNVLKVGIMPTPGVAYLTRHYNADVGVVISASHNSFEYNGIKLFNGKGYKLDDELENEIERIVKNKDFPEVLGKSIGTIEENYRAELEYAEFLKSVINLNLEGLRIGVDCANGAAYRIVPQIFSDMGAEVFIINDKPTGYNINLNCGSTHPEVVSELVLEKNLDIGISFDGDADRVIVVDENGKTLDGDHIMAICGEFMNKKGKLKKSTIVTTTMSNIGLEKTLKRVGCNMIRTDVGDKYVLQEMIRNGYILGGEQSGHIIFLEHNTTGDGLLTALQVLNIMKDTGKSISDLGSSLKVLPQVLLNARVEDKTGLNGSPKIADKIRKAEEKLKNEGRILIRPSGTEPFIRVMVEGENQIILKQIAEEIVETIENELN